MMVACTIIFVIGSCFQLKIGRRVIAFGARSLGDTQPKYLNSGEGQLFQKTVLYGWVQAREGLRRGLPFIVAEGYMDVIAIHRSGVAAAAAPLEPH